MDFVAVVQGIQHGQIAFTRHAEHAVHAMQDKRIHQGVGGTIHLVVSLKTRPCRNCNTASSRAVDLPFHSTKPAASGQR